MTGTEVLPNSSPPVTRESGRRCLVANPAAEAPWHGAPVWLALTHPVNRETQPRAGLGTEAGFGG